MDPVLDPPTSPSQQTAAVTAASPTHGRNYAHKHPPYAEMIAAAISALKERNGSSKRAISKYIGDHYSGLPSTHEALLSYHLKRLKINGQLLMVKHSYKLPRSSPVNGITNAAVPDPTPAGPKRRPGRPPKLKSEVPQVAFPVFQPSAAARQPLRGRGRPPKLHGVKRLLGQQPKAGGRPSGGSAGRGRGRPRLAAPPPPVRKGPGRPPKSINAVQGLGQGWEVPGSVPASARGALSVDMPLIVNGGVGPVKRGRGRPPKASGVAKRVRNLGAVRPKKPRKLSGKPLGRPRKNSSGGAVNRAPDSHLLVTYLDLKEKLENLQLRISEMANFIKPYLNNEAAINALQELELIAVNMTMPPPNGQNQPPQSQPEPPLLAEQYPLLQPQN